MQLAHYIIQNANLIISIMPILQNTSCNLQMDITIIQIASKIVSCKNWLQIVESSLIIVSCCKILNAESKVQNATTYKCIMQNAKCIMQWEKWKNGKMENAIIYTQIATC